MSIESSKRKKKKGLVTSGGKECQGKRGRKGTRNLGKSTERGGSGKSTHRKEKGNR